MKIRPNYIYALVSMTLVLFLAGVFGSIILQSQQLVRLFKEKVVLLVEIENGYPTDAIESLVTEIDSKDYVKLGTVDFTSKSDAAKIMEHEFEEVNLEELNMVNPFNDIITFNVKAEQMNEERLKIIATELEVDNRISDVSYEGNIASSLGYWHRVGWIGLAVSLILVMVAIFLIIYAVRQALYTDRFLIKNMHLVGATPGFIIRPYARWGIIGGVISALAAGGGLVLLRWWLMSQVKDMEELFTTSGLIMIFILMLAVGVVITAGAAWTTVRRYLKSDVNELYS